MQSLQQRQPQDRSAAFQSAKEMLTVLSLSDGGFDFAVLPQDKQSRTAWDPRKHFRKGKKNITDQELEHYLKLSWDEGCHVFLRPRDEGYIFIDADSVGVNAYQYLHSLNPVITTQTSSDNYQFW